MNKLKKMNDMKNRKYGSSAFCRYSETKLPLLFLLVTLAMSIPLHAQDTIDTFPWTEEFDYTAGTLPSGWTRVASCHSGSLDYPVVQSRRLRFRTTADSCNFLATPTFAARTGYLLLEFDVKGGGGDVLSIGTVPTAADTGLFYPQVDLALGTEYGSSQHVSFAIEVPSGQTFCLAFKVNANSSTYYVEMDNLVVTASQCMPPASPFVATSVGANDVSLAWHSASDGLGLGYIVAYRPTGSEEWRHLPLTSDTSAAIGGLIPMTEYLFRVGVLCEDDTVYLGTTLSVTTPCGPYPVPFEEDFGQALNACWTVESGMTRSSSGYMIFGSGTGGTMRRLVTPVIGAPVSQWTVRIGFRGSSPSGKMAVGVVDANDSLLAVSDTMMGTEYYSNNETLFRTYRFDSLAVDSCRLVVMGRQLNLYSIEIQATECSPVDSIWLTGVSEHTADMEWTNLEGDGYRVLCSSADGTDTFYVNENWISIDSLRHMTTYRVRVYPVCADGDSAIFSPELVFRTLREEVTLPYEEDFEACEADSVPDAWIPLASSMLNGHSYPSVYSGNNAHAGNKALKLNATSSESNLIVTPLLPRSPSGYNVSFWMRGVGTLYVGTVDSMLSPGSFVACDTIEHNVSVGNTWIRHEMQVGDAQTRYVAFRWLLSGYECLIDDLAIHASEQCAVPQGVQVEPSSDGFFLVWDSTGAVAYQLGFGLTDDLPSATIITLDSVPQALLDTLRPDMPYYLWLRSICAEGDTSAWNWLGSHRTACLPMGIPYIERFDSTLVDGRPACWHIPADSIRNGLLMRRVRVEEGGAYDTRGLKLEASLEAPALAATAPVPLPADSIGVAFRAYIPSALEFVTQHLRAGVTADPADTNSFVALVDTSLTGGEWIEIAFNTFDLPLEGEVRVAFWLQMGTAWIDNLRIDSVRSVRPACEPARNLRVGEVDSSSVALEWDATGDDFEVEVMDADGNTVARIATDSNALVVDSLSPLTYYGFRLRAACPGDPTAWTEALTVRTACPSPYHVPFAEDFSDVDRGYIPECWHSQMGWGTMLTGDSSLRCSVDEEVSVIATPPLLANRTVTVSLRFRMGRYNPWVNDPAHLRIGIMPANGTGGNMLAYVDSTTMDFFNYGPLWHSLQFSYTPDGDEFRLAFELQNGEFEVDDISIQYAAVDTLWRTLTLGADAPSMGTVSGAGRYPDSSLVAITASPFEGFRFLRWSDGDTNASRTLLLVSDSALVAHFDTIPDVGIDDLRLQASGLVVYPNPASSRVRVESDGMKVESVAVLDLNGRVVQDYRGLAGRTSVTLDVSPLPGGVYYLRIGTSAGTVVRKLVVQ